MILVTQCNTYSIPLFVQPLADGQQKLKTGAKGASVLTGRHAGTQTFMKILCI